MVAQLLGSKQPTDILEAIEFFVSGMHIFFIFFINPIIYGTYNPFYNVFPLWPAAFEFGVLNAMLGVRKMLALIWSRETNIKAGFTHYIQCCGTGTVRTVTF